MPNNNLLTKKQWRFVAKYEELTPRELQIAELVCHGLMNKAIAERLRISPGTVKVHIRNIYMKIRVKNKIQMLLKFVNDARILKAP